MYYILANDQRVGNVRKMNYMIIILLFYSKHTSLNWAVYIMLMVENIQDLYKIINKLKNKTKINRYCIGLSRNQ